MHRSPPPGHSATSLPTWLDLPSHRAWLDARFADVLRFARTSPLPGGGFAYQDADGTARPGHRPQLFLTARMAHTSALGVLRGIPGAGALLDHAVESLLGLHRDTRHGGWLTEPGSVTRKAAYDHVHVGLGASSALRAGHPRAAELLAQVREIIDARLWDAATQTFRESFAADWSDEEPYRGANANMHGVEALLAIFRATGDGQCLQRALAVCERLVDASARSTGWLMVEHFAPDWTPLPDYNRDQPNHPFRPYGATPGHLLEWARLLVELHEGLAARSPAWLLESAAALSREALDDLWGIDGRPGLVYTVDWDGRPVSTLHLHWPICEAIQASAALRHHTGDDHWEQWYRRTWDHAARWFIDDRGAWINELDGAMREGASVWPGRPDVYHCGGALVGPLELGERRR